MHIKLTAIIEETKGLYTISSLIPGTMVVSNNLDEARLIFQRDMRKILSDKLGVMIAPDAIEITEIYKGDF